MDVIWVRFYLLPGSSLNAQNWVRCPSLCFYTPLLPLTTSLVSFSGSTVVYCVSPH